MSSSPWKFRALFLIAALACDGDAHRISGPPSNGNVIATVHVSGQRELGRLTWPLRFDEGNSIELTPEVADTFTVASGDHTFTFDGVLVTNSIFDLFSFAPVDWCIIQGEKTRSVRVSSDAPTRLDYSIDCPELKGSGTFNVSFTASGPAAPDLLIVSMNRVTGQSYKTAVTLAPGVVRSVIVPAGVYQVFVDNVACSGFGIPILHPWEDLLIRDQWSPVVAIVLNC